MIKLTSITQKTIDSKGLDFKDAFNIFYKFIKRSKVLCNGNDGSVINKNLFLNDVKKKIKIFNIKNLLINKYKIPKKYSSSPLIQSYFGYKVKQNRTHNALYDCISILNSLRKIKFILRDVN